MRSYEERAKSFIEEIYPYLIGNLISNDFYHADRNVERYNKDKSRKVQIKEGMSRTVLVTSDYVVKIDKKLYCSYGTCEDECTAYSKAKAAGFEHLFAKPTPYKFNGYTFYIMPRIRNINPWRVDDDYYMEFVTSEEQDWLDDHIHDLHSGNYGFKNGKLVIVDYAWNNFG